MSAGNTTDNLVVRGGTVVDGTGLPRRVADVVVRDGRVVSVGRADRATVDESEIFDADGLVVAPGVVDVHTHYDPQLTFDPLASMSIYHGVTTVLAGNCGFSIAPTRADDRDFIRRLFAKVEQMESTAMDAVDFDFESFPEYLRARQGRLGLNLACYIGHSNVRRWVMGAAGSEREATDAEVAEMQEVVRAAMRAGAAGLSSSHAPTHLDGDSRPVPSRFSSRDELLALAEAAGSTGGGSITYLPASAVGGIDAEDEAYCIALGERAGLPIIIQGLGGRNKTDAPTATWERAQAFLNRAVDNGTPIYNILIARPPDRPLTIGPENMLYLSVPSWVEMLALPHDERVKALHDPERRAVLRHAVENYNRDPELGTTTPPPMWHTVHVQNVHDGANAALVGRSLADIADERGEAPADVMLDLALSEDLRTGFRWNWETDEWRAAVREAQLDPRMIIGTSDGGAHLARDDAADWSSWFLRNWVLDRAVWSLEDGIRQITQVPAAIIGIGDRGTLQPGRWADIMIFDPDRIDAGRKEFVRDLPGGAGRFKAWPEGVHATIVNGVPAVVDGEPTGRLPGRVTSPGAAHVV
ncbi:MAG: amidohydrolase family protein [Acidimicrobiales bacterium]|nr:amidohydrolase family protein [Acidimicrobiales bacterium]